MATRTAYDRMALSERALLGDLPEAAFYMVGGIEEAAEKAKSLQ